MLPVVAVHIGRQAADAAGAHRHQTATHAVLGDDEHVGGSPSSVGRRLAVQAASQVVTQLLRLLLSRQMAARRAALLAGGAAVAAAMSSCHISSGAVGLGHLLRGPLATLLLATTTTLRLRLLRLRRWRRLHLARG